MTVPDLQTIEFAITDTIATIQLNRPDAANGMNVEMMRELLTAVMHCDGNKDIRAIILTGNGKMFSAGGDLRYFASRSCTPASHALHTWKNHSSSPSTAWRLVGVSAWPWQVTLYWLLKALNTQWPIPARV